MTSATVATRVEPLEREGAPDRPAVAPRDAGVASGGHDGRPATTGTADPSTELGATAGREGAK